MKISDLCTGIGALAGAAALSYLTLTYIIGTEFISSSNAGGVLAGGALIGGIGGACLARGAIALITQSDDTIQMRELPKQMQNDDDLDRYLDVQPPAREII